jgi:hypothetical protein
VDLRHDRAAECRLDVPHELDAEHLLARRTVGAQTRSARS